MATETVVAILTSIASSAVFTTVMMKLFEVSISKSADRVLATHKAALDAKNQEAIERLKSDLSTKNQEALERLKAELGSANAKEIEQAKAGFAAENESLRHRYQLERFRVEMATKHRDEVYSELLDKIRRAEGAVAPLRGFREVPNLENFSENDLRKLLDDLSITEKLKTEHLEKVQRDRKAGLRAVEQLMYRVDIRKAGQLLSDAKNHLILKELYVSPDVEELAFEVINEFRYAQIEAEVSEDSGGSYAGKNFPKHMESATKKLAELKALMRRELTPPA